MVTCRHDVTTRQSPFYQEYSSLFAIFFYWPPLKIFFFQMCRDLQIVSQKLDSHFVHSNSVAVNLVTGLYYIKMVQRGFSESIYLCLPLVNQSKEEDTIYILDSTTQVIFGISSLPALQKRCLKEKNIKLKSFVKGRKVIWQESG